MSVMNLSPGSVCWLHPGERVIGVCATCLKERLGRLAFFPNSSQTVAPRYSFDASYLRRKGDGVGVFGSSRTISTLIESEAESFEEDVPQRCSSAANILRSKSVSVRKGSSFYACNERSVQWQTCKEESALPARKTEITAAACEENKAIEAWLGSRGGAKSEDDGISHERKTLRDLFCSDDHAKAAVQTSDNVASDNASFSDAVKHKTLQEEQVIPANGDGNDSELKKKLQKEGKASKSIASLIEEELFQKSRSGRSPSSKSCKKQGMSEKQAGDPKLEASVKDQASELHRSNTYQATSSFVISFPRSCSGKVSNVENQSDAATMDISYRNKLLISTGGSEFSVNANDSSFREPRHSGKRDLNIKNFSPSNPISSQDLKADISCGTNEPSNDQNKISCLIALDLYERKQLSRSSNNSKNLWIKTFASPMQAIRSRQFKKDEVLFHQGSISSDKAKGMGTQLMVDGFKKQSRSSPRSHSEDHSLVSFYLSPLRRSRRKWTEKLERSGRDTNNSSPSTLENSSPWSFYLTPSRFRRNKVNR